MTHRMQGWLLVLTAFVTAFLIYLKNDVGTAFPYSDGGSHYVTGLLAYDWLHAPQLSNPMQYGTEYFKHLPYIGLLLWPPLFYGMEMVAFSIFGPTIQVAMVLCTAIFALGAVVLGLAVRKGGYGILVAHVAAATLLTSTLIQEVQRNLLIDGLVSILSLAAALQFAYFLVKPSWRGAWFTGLLAILAFYAKGNGVQLGVVFPLLALMLRRPGMLFDRRTLAMAAACIVITGPWLYVTAGLSAQGFLYTFSLSAMRELAGAHLMTVYHAMPILAPFALIGAGKAIYRTAKAHLMDDGETMFMAACFSLVVGSVLFHTLTPVATDARYMLGGLLGAFGLAVTGVDTVVRWLIARSGRLARPTLVSALVAVVLAIQAVTGLLTPLPVIPGGMGNVAAEIMKVLPANNRGILLSGDHNVETSIGPALAQLDGKRATKDGIVVVRGSRAFAGGAYRNRDYIPKFKDEAAYRAELNRLAIPVIVTATPKPHEIWGHIASIEQLLARPDSDYVKTAQLPFFKEQTVTIWRRKDALLQPMNFEAVTESNSLRERVNKVVN